jgi:putative transposase
MIQKGDLAMGRTKRQWVSQLVGSFHIISRVAGGTGSDFILQDQEKEYFLKLLERFASGFFVRVHAFAIMSNHFHILATGMELEAKKASKQELLRRYKLLYPKESEPPPGRYEPNGEIIWDEDGGIERLRERLGSISRFIQELKQTFSRCYNKTHNRKGYLWNDRFKGVIVNHGEAQLLCSAYIDLNPVRAGIVVRPEDYRWCSMGLRVRNPKRSKKLLTFFSVSQQDEWSDAGLVAKFKTMNPMAWYREFVYLLGGVAREGKASIPGDIIAKVVSYHGKLGLGDCFRYRVRNISEGLAIGSYWFIANFQKQCQRKFIRPRSFLSGNCNVLYSTRVLRQ